MKAHPANASSTSVSPLAAKSALGLSPRSATPAAAEDSGDRLQFGLLQIDVPHHAAHVDGKAVTLTATEFNLLAVLAKRRGRVQTRERLLQDVWGYETAIDTRTVDTHMRRLREKIGPAAEYLETIRGVGYRFKADS